MIKVEHIETWGFEHAIRGMRNPMNSWDKSDSKFNEICIDAVDCCAFSRVVNKIGRNDLDLMHRLYVAGQPHRKFLRQIFVSMDITAPLYWWKEFDTYKVGTTSNSCSTMHKIHDKEFTLDDFSHEHLFGEEDSIDEPIGTLSFIVNILNMWRDDYLRTKDKDAWWQMIQLLPSSYNQKRTITMNYENVVNIIEYRTGHKLDEWNEFVDILWKLPYLKEIAGGREKMKLVVDIPDEEYENVKKAGGCYYDFGKAIYYGTPYETVTEFADRCRECGREKVLDKIRDEIQAMADIEWNTQVGSVSQGLEDAIEIIDKYRAESEE